MHRLLRQREDREPLVLMTGGAGWKVAPALDVPHELVEGLIFDGLLAIDAARG
jgi:type III pantothenate kinase